MIHGGLSPWVPSRRFWRSSLCIGCLRVKGDVGIADRRMNKMRVRGLNQAFLHLASCALAAAAHASYGQMRLDGAGLLLAFVLTVGYALIVDVALIAGLFRYR